VTPGDLAEAACHIEIDRLGEPVGKQDQYVAAFGGVNCYEFRPDGTVAVQPLEISDDTLREFEVRVLLFSTGITRQAPAILRDQDDRTRVKSGEMIANLHAIKQIGYESRATLESGRLDAYGELLHEHWERKRRRSQQISNPRIDSWYEVARRNGARGGKLIGAGGGGFLMFLADDPTRLRRALEAEGLHELRFAFDFEGTRIL
jgi:D-glycero-alpha-D-manno-heptose-7-phosphate kinase